MAEYNGKTVAAWIIGIVAVGCVVGVAVDGAFGDDDSTTVPRPTTTEAADTVAILRKAADEQDVCYGWRLWDGSWPRSDTPISTGSNLGDGVAVDSDPVRCPRWVEVVAEVRYTPESSEQSDWVSVEVKSTEDVSGFAIEQGLERLGLDDEAYLDEPGWAVTRAAVFLPLLLAEQGDVPAIPVDTDAAVSPSPLPDPGPDLWRDRWGYLLAGAAMLLITVVLVLIGRAQARRERAAAEVPKQRPATGDTTGGHAANVQKVARRR